MKSLVLVMAMALPVIGTAGQKSKAEKKHAPPSRVQTPTAADVDAALKRIYGYDPSIQWKIFMVRRSAVPGMNEVLLQLKGEFHHLFLTADGHFAIDEIGR